MTVECVVVGAGPAGLAASAALTDRGVDHLVLERSRPAASWRDQRWRSFRLNTPGWFNDLLGGQAHDAFADREEVVERLDDRARGCPVRSETPVTRLEPVRDRFRLEAAGTEVVARTAVLATGDQNDPLTPGLAASLPADVCQVHAASYWSAEDLPPGAVLVVGSAQSGGQIAADLLDAGRRVLLSTSPVARLPWYHRGRPIVEWLVPAGFFDQRPQDLPDPAAMRAPQPIVGSGGRSLSLQSLARRGALLVGRLVDVRGSVLVFDDGVAKAIAAGDAVARQLRQLADAAIDAQGVQAPASTADDADDADEAVTDEGGTVDPPRSLHLRDDDIGAVVWCTGFGADDAYLDQALLDERGTARRDGAAGAVPGLWLIGRKWLRRRDSGIFRGFPSDAAHVADAVVGHLAGR